jgi:hypothetical protein
MFFLNTSSDVNRDGGKALTICFTNNKGPRTDPCDKPRLKFHVHVCLVPRNSYLHYKCGRLHFTARGF